MNIKKIPFSFSYDIIFLLEEVLMNKTIFITGHKNPDTDSICSTIAYAELKKKLGYDVLPIRIGNINSETAYVLHKFDVEAPQLFYDIRTRVSDIHFDDVVTVNETATISTAWRLMLDNDKKVIAIVKNGNTLVGLATISGITNGILSVAQNRYDLMKQTPLDCITETLMGELVVRPRDYHPSGIITVASGILVDKEFIGYQDQIVITSSREESQLKAIHTGAALIVVTLATEISNEVMIAATKNNCAIIVTTLDIFTTSQLITQAIPIYLIMTTNLVTFNYFDYLDDVKAIIPKSRFRSYPVVDSNNELKGLISRYHLWGHDRKQIILVDHNETTQSIEGIEQADVIEIVDHHRIGDIQTNTPVTFRNEIVGSCATIIAKMYRESGIEIEKKIAGILCGAIISDTMHFNSPTCTEEDRNIAYELATIAELDIENFSEELYLASASLAGKTISEIVHTDLKEFNIDSYRITVSQLNIIDPETIQSIKDETLEYLENLCVSNRYDLSIIVFTDIKEKGSYFLSAGKDIHLFELAFSNKLKEKNGLVFIENMMSRKQQFIPALAKAISSYKNK